MLEMSDEALAVVRADQTIRIRAESWLGGQLLADDIPVATGTETRDASMAVPERIVLTVPRRDRGFDWTPYAADHPLASYGQQLRIEYGIEVGRHIEWINRGWFLIDEVDTDGDDVQVTLLGLLALIEEAKFTAPFQPSSTDTLATVTRALVEPALTAVIDSTLTSRAVPLGMQWDEDRLGALKEVLTAWPADARVTEDGVLLLERLDETGDPVFDLTDDGDGTVIRWQGSSSRDAAFNAVVAVGEDLTGNTIQGVVYDDQAGSPFRYGGNFNPLPVPYRTQSPLLRTVAECKASAAATLQKLRRGASRHLTVTTLPHPGLMTGDVVTVTGAGLVGQRGVIDAFTLPYSTDAMTLTVRVI